MQLNVQEIPSFTKGTHKKERADTGYNKLHLSLSPSLCFLYLNHFDEEAVVYWRKRKYFAAAAAAAHIKVYVE